MFWFKTLCLFFLNQNIDACPRNYKSNHALRKVTVFIKTSQGIICYGSNKNDAPGIFLA
jgi:hypothetical protein